MQISATDPVAILIHCNDSCPFVQFVGKNISLRTICLEFSCKRAQSRTCSGYAERSRKSRRRGSTERSDGNRVRSARICVASTMCLEGTTPQDLPLNKTSLHSCQFVRPNRSPFMFIDTKIRVNSCDSWAYKNLSWATKNSRPLYAFFIPEKPVNPALIPLIRRYPVVKAVYSCPAQLYTTRHSPTQF